MDFVNKAPFFGIAVGGSLGADKVRCAVVARLRACVRVCECLHLLFVLAGCFFLFFSGLYNSLSGTYIIRM